MLTLTERLDSIEQQLSLIKRNIDTNPSLEEVESTREEIFDALNSNRIAIESLRKAIAGLDKIIRRQ
jgi:hypothetical protein